MFALALQILTLATTPATASGTFINATTYYTVAITVAPGPTVPLSLKPGARGPSWAAWPKRILVERGIPGADPREFALDPLPAIGAVDVLLVLSNYSLYLVPSAKWRDDSPKDEKVIAALAILRLLPLD
jgi:hypothetical protein